MVEPAIFFCATLFGIFCLFVRQISYVVLMYCAGIVLYGLLELYSRTWFRPYLRLSNWLCQLYWLVGFVGISAFTMVSTKVALMLPSYLNLPPEEGKVVSGVLIGSLNALLGALLLDDAKKPDGRLWPNSVFKNRLQAAFKSDFDSGHFPANKNDLNWAINGDFVENTGIRGWSWRDRKRRVSLIYKELRNRGLSA